MDTSDADIKAVEIAYQCAFAEAENSIKNHEYIDQEVYIPAINELRYAGSHASKALISVSPREKIEKYHAAIKHCERARFDSLDAQYQYYLRECRVFREDYKFVVISEVFPKYIEDASRLEEIKRLVRQEEDKQIRCQHVEQHLTEIRRIYEGWSIAREELNKRRRKERYDVFYKTVGMTVGVLTILGIIMGFVASVF
ncbi:MAG: hypothetical protein LBC20_13980 [Planctomycetaceae bacterium]|jgi:hypothetical protein|nr:hypothetical protein [Planctomycetaceae bacterium]